MAGTPGVLKVVTWNVWGEPATVDARGAAVLDVLRRGAADVVALQEVRTHRGRSQAAALAEALGMEAVEATPWACGDASMGNAVLTRLPVLRSTATPLPVADPAEARVVLTVDVGTPRGPLALHCTHLSWKPGEEAVRRAQAQEVHRLAAASSRAGRATLICGDLNAEPDSEIVAAIRGDDAFVDVWVQANGTHGGATWDLRNPHTRGDVWPTRRIDFIFARSGDDGPGLRPLSATLVGDGPVDGIWPSDHFGVAATLALDAQRDP